MFKAKRISAIFVVVLTGYGFALTVQAEQRGRGISYSPEHWPSRWSNAIRQQQNGSYPVRPRHAAPPPDLPKETGWEVSEQDLFMSPERGIPGQQLRRRSRQSDLPHFRNYARKVHADRKAAYAYYGMPPLNPTQVYPAMYGQQGIAIDPVLGHPGIGIPVMPGVPYGYPFIGMTPGFAPGAFGPWGLTY